MEDYKNLKIFLDEIKEKPVMFLGRESLSLLSSFLGGYLYAIGKIKEEWVEFFPGFQEWIQEIYHIESTHNWSDIILFYEQDDAKAFHKFYDLLEEFITKK